MRDILCSYCNKQITSSSRAYFIKLFLEVFSLEFNAIQILINGHEFLFGNVNIELTNVPCDELFS